MDAHLPHAPPSIYYWDLVICEINQAQHVAITSTQRLLVGIRNSKVRYLPALQAYPAKKYRGCPLVIY
jgi:hypothetical protein